MNQLESSRPIAPLVKPTKKISWPMTICLIILSLFTGLYLIEGDQILFSWHAHDDSSIGNLYFNLSIYYPLLIIIIGWLLWYFSSSKKVIKNILTVYLIVWVVILIVNFMGFRVVICHSAWEYYHCEYWTGYHLH